MSKANSKAISPPMLSSIPALHAFDLRTTTWQSYRDRINFYFKANRIDTDDDKKALFLWSVGDTTYNLLESLVSPKSLVDDDTGFTDLIKLLDSHYDATKNIMTATYDFYSCHQKPGQSFAEWKAELCAKLRYCGFTTSVLKNKPQDRALRDMYVIGINNPKIRQALLKEQDPDLESAEKIIQLAERLQEDVRHFGTSVDHTVSTVAKVQSDKYNRRSQPPNKSAPKVVNKPCQTCGATNHPRSQCKYRDFTCNFCKRSGHLERVCRQKKDEKKITKRITTSQTLRHVNQRKQSTSGSTTVLLHVNGHDCTFELDTGADNTIISVKDWQNMGSPTIRPSPLTLECYSGKPLRVKGQCDVIVHYGSQTFNLTMIVVHGTGSPLLGLQWMTAMQIDLNRIVHGSNYVRRSVCKLYSQVQLQAKLGLSRYNRTHFGIANAPAIFQRKIRQVIAGMPNCAVSLDDIIITGVSPSDMLLQRPIRTELARLKPDSSKPIPTHTQYHIGQLVWAMDRQLNKRPNWQPARIQRNIGSMLYERQLTTGQLWKRHQSQLCPRQSHNYPPSDLDSLPDDLLDRNKKPRQIDPPRQRSPRYPRRNRKPPEHYSPT
jgi:hypothetical protein